jgi:hypothetical protein
MSNFARVEDGLVAELTDIDPAGRYHPSPVWLACSAEVAVGWAHDNGTFTAPPPPPPAPLAPPAKAALDASDIVVLRCCEHGVAVPEEWRSYRAALREIVNCASAATALPPTPEYPANT